MERFGNASHDGIQKLMDKSENKNTTKATATCVSKHRGEVLEIEKVEPRKPDQILHIFTELK